VNERFYWSERNGRRSAAPLSFTQVKQLFVVMVQQAAERGDLQEHFGYDCVDDDFVPGLLGSAIPERLLLDLGWEVSWPLTTSVGDWDEDAFFDLTEYMYDHVSRGRKETGRLHSYSDCGWHFTHFDALPAREQYRLELNRILRRWAPGFELSGAGEMLRTAPTGLDSLHESAPKLLSPNQRALVDGAIHKYRARSSSSTDRRDAVRDLADVLEHMRADVKRHMFSKDEGLLFQTANNFWIRHNDPDQRTDYDHDAWWSWLFYMYLSSIALVTHLVERQELADAPEGA
jgi:hypothetical protein